MFQCAHQMTSVSKLMGKLQAGEKRVRQCLRDKRLVFEKIHTIKNTLKSQWWKARPTDISWQYFCTEQKCWVNSGGFQEGPKADCRKTPRCVVIHKSLQVRLTSEPETMPPGAPNASLIDKSNSQTRSCGTQGIKPDEAATNVSS